jgi:hypothetical protein
VTDQTETATPEKIISGHVTTLHLIGEQLSQIESWFWEHLADVRAAARTVQAPAADRAALRDRVAAAIWERQNPGRRWADCEHPWGADAEEDADAVLAVLPAPTDRAAVLSQTERDMLRYALDLAQEQMLSRGDEFGDGDQAAVTSLRRLTDEAQPAQPDGLRCVCGDPVQLMDDNDPTSWIHTPGSNTRCLEARPRCPHCQLPHAQTPQMQLMCASIRASIRDRDAAEAQQDEAQP